MSQMQQVLAFVERGVSDRSVIAKELGITRKQVNSALYNLRYTRRIEPVAHRTGGPSVGRLDTIYKVTGAFVSRTVVKERAATSVPFNGVSSIFDVRVK
jgi:hypothetical protein